MQLGDVLCREEEVRGGNRRTPQGRRNRPQLLPGLADIGAKRWPTWDVTTRPFRATKFSCSIRRPQRSDAEILGYLDYVKRQPRKALEYWTSFLDNNPDSLPVLTMTAWLLATDPDPARPQRW